MATAHIRQLNKKPTFVLLTCLLPFFVTKESRILEKKVNETRVSRAVLFSNLYFRFSHCRTMSTQVSSLLARFCYPNFDSSGERHLILCQLPKFVSCKDIQMRMKLRTFTSALWNIDKTFWKIDDTALVKVQMKRIFFA